MKSIFKTILSFLLFIPFTYAQKNQIKAAQKELKAGNSEQVIAILSPVEYLISNASDGDRIHFYFLKGTALVNLASRNNNNSKNLLQALTAFSDLIEVEKEANQYKYTALAIESLYKIKKGLIYSANEDMLSENYAESSNKFYQAYLIDKRDTLQLYNAAFSYKSAHENDLALQCYEELRAINYSGNHEVFIAYSKSKLTDEYFDTLTERDTRIQSGTHFRPRQELQSKKAEIYKSIALIYVQSGYKEKAMKAISQARNLDGKDLSLALVEANLYLETKDYDYFDNLVSVIIESNPTNAALVTQLGLNCQNEQYYEGAEYYYKRAIAMNPNYMEAYVNLSALLVEKSIKIGNQMNDYFGSSTADRNAFRELKIEKEQIDKRVYNNLQKVVAIDPFNSSVKQLLNSLNTANSIISSRGALASGE
jgi:tetratricopeptide (TPR) repeat protein